MFSKSTPFLCKWRLAVSALWSGQHKTSKKKKPTTSCIRIYDFTCHDALGEQVLTSSAGVFHWPRLSNQSTVWSSFALADQEGKPPHLQQAPPSTVWERGRPTGSSATAPDASKKQTGHKWTCNANIRLEKPIDIPLPTWSLETLHQNVKISSSAQSQ